MIRIIPRSWLLPCSGAGQLPWQRLLGAQPWCVECGAQAVLTHDALLLGHCAIEQWNHHPNYYQ